MQRSCPDTSLGRTPGGRFTEVEEVTSEFLQRYKIHISVHVCGAVSSQAGGRTGDLPPVVLRSPGAARWPGKGPDLGSACTQPGAHRCLCPPQGPGSSWTAEFQTHGHPATPLLASLLAATRGHKERSRAQPAPTTLWATDWGVGRTQRRQTPAGREGPHHCQKQHQ